MKFPGTFKYEVTGISAGSYCKLGSFYK